MAAISKVSSSIHSDTNEHNPFYVQTVVQEAQRIERAPLGTN